MTAPTPWATPTDVAEVTGATVTDAQLGRAQTVIELRVGRTSAATPNLLPSALRWLKLAVCYQAAWMKGQPDLFERSDVEQVGQDGASTRYRPDGLTLAPLARRAMKRLPWKSTRTTYTAGLDRPDDRYFPAAEGVGGVRDFADDPWRPM